MPRREDLLDGSIRIHFDAPIPFHAEPRQFLTLRQPTLQEVWDHGDPLTIISTADGAVTEHVQRPGIIEWIGRLIVDHDIEFLKPRQDIVLAILIERAVLDFFHKAALTLLGSSRNS